ncbi:rCG19921 [Rattus norvegicus]|uniref:RCG19921 n=1 Tax=Rattus norvegicus TaxID=10116 RepID=A6MGW4_RAT|nr:rCG19921 [Rattus norvegicus]
MEPSRSGHLWWCLLGRSRVTHALWSMRGCLSRLPRDGSLLHQLIPTWESLLFWLSLELWLSLYLWPSLELL